MMKLQKKKKELKEIIYDFNIFICIIYDFIAKKIGTKSNNFDSITFKIGSKGIIYDFLVNTAFACIIYDSIAKKM